MYTYGFETGIVLLPFLLLSLAFAVFMVVAQWRIFAKAGEPGWACLVPFYGSYVLAKITFGNGWLFLLMAIPFVNFIFAIIQTSRLSTAFGKGLGFTFGLLFLAFIFYPILAFGDSEYSQPF